MNTQIRVLRRYVIISVNFDIGLVLPTDLTNRPTKLDDWFGATQIMALGNKVNITSNSVVCYVCFGATDVLITIIQRS